jgi:hypothetical protein
VHNVDTAKPEPAYQEFLNRPIRELGLTLAGSPVERFVEQLYRELNAKGLTKFRPACYLTDYRHTVLSGACGPGATGKRNA